MKSHVEADSQGDVTILKLIGYFHGYEAPLKAAMGGIQGSRVVIDFSGCKFLGSGAFGALFELAQTLRLRDGDVKLTGLPPPLPGRIGPGRRIFDQYETVAEAVAAFT